jgi:hypothetical protein
MTDFVRITNPADVPGPDLSVQTIRQDVAPGEPASLLGHVTLRAQESALFQVFEGSVIVVGKGNAHG